MKSVNTIGAFGSALVLALAAGRLPAQSINTYYRNQMNNASAVPPAQTQASAGQPYAPPPPGYNPNQPPAGFNPLPPPGGFGGYGAGYGYGYPTYSPVGGALNGLANVTNANGQYLIQTQQARQADQQVQQSRIDTQRKLFDERRYELANTPTQEELRLLDMQAAYDRARNNPPNTEIWDGSAPNELLRVIQSAPGLQGPAIPLDPRLLQQINFTTGSVRGGAGAITSGKLDWPLILTQADFADNRMKIEELTATALMQSASGGVKSATLDQLNATVKAMQAQVDDMINSLSPDDCMKATRFLRELKQGFGVLGAPDAKAYLDRSWLNQVRTVPQLVSAMSQRGLKFAPTAPGGEAAYTALQYNLVVYDQALAQVARR
jgi:hypothetical protein